MTNPKIAFVYLLNRMENAASAKDPSKAGFSEHRNAVVEHVNRIETELAAARKKYNDALIHATNAEQYQAKQLADARAALRDVFASDGSEGIYDAVKLYAARERARNLLAKQG